MSCLIWCVCVRGGIEDKDGSADVEMICHVSFGVGVGGGEKIRMDQLM